MNGLALLAAHFGEMLTRQTPFRHAYRSTDTFYLVQHGMTLLAGVALMLGARGLAALLRDLRHRGSPVAPVDDATG